MRRILVGTIAAVAGIGLLTGEASGQLPVPLTVAAGPTFATISSDEFETSMTTGFFASVGVHVPLSDAVYLSPFLAYVQKGAEFDDGSTDSYDYIEIPLLIGTTIPVGTRTRLGFSAGPQVGFQINCDEDGFDCSEYEDHQGTEFGLVGLVDLKIPLSETSTISIGGGFDLGLTNLYEDLDYKTRTFSIFAAWTYVP